MPFDDTSVRAEPEEARILSEMERLLARPEDWCQGNLRRRGVKSGTVRRCLYGALFDTCHLNDATTLDKHSAARRAEAILLKSVPGVFARAPCGNPIASFNDSKLTTHADILALLARAKAKVLETV